MGKKTRSRYDQLSDEQRKALSEQPAKLIVSNALNSFAGPPENLEYFRKHYMKLSEVVHGWKTAEMWLAAYVNFSSNPRRNASRGYEAIVSQFSSGFARFIVETGRTEVGCELYDADLVFSFEEWLKSSSNLQIKAAATQRRYYFAPKLLLQELTGVFSKSTTYPSPTIFKNKAFNDDGGKPTESLSDVVWDALRERLAKKARSIRSQVEKDWETLEGDYVYPDFSRRGSGAYGDRAAALFELQRQSVGGIVPRRSEISEGPFFSAVDNAYGFRNLSQSFYPTCETIFPFVLLLAIYTQANTSPLRSLKLSRINEIEVLGSKRMTLFVGEAELDDDSSKASARVELTLEKGRIHGNYTRSFAVDASDPLSPSEIVGFLRKWTSKIRPIAEQAYRDNLFIFLGHTGRVRGFFNSRQSGTDGDSSWFHSFRRFLSESELEGINIKSIRTTGLNKVDEVMGGDLISVQVAAGHEKGSTTANRSYHGDAAKQRKIGRLAPVASSMARWAATGGRSHVRGSPDGVDIGAATPGFTCLDPYDSPIPGQTPGRLCSAFGHCPDCPLGNLNILSAYSLARCVQLFEETKRAQEYVVYSRWKEVWLPVQRKLNSVWLPQFTDGATIESARMLNLEPIGRLE